MNGTSLIENSAHNVRCGPRQLGSTPTVPRDCAHAPDMPISHDISPSASGFVTTPLDDAAADITRFRAVLYRRAGGRAPNWKNCIYVQIVTGTCADVGGRCRCGRNDTWND